MEEPLLLDDQPSWVTLAAEEAEAGNQYRDAGFGEASQIWAQEGGVGFGASSSRKSSPSASGDDADVPKIVLFMRLGASTHLLIIHTSMNVNTLKKKFPFFSASSLAWMFLNNFVSPFCRKFGSCWIIDIWIRGEHHKFILPLQNGPRRLRSLLRTPNLLP
ncbi:hypothetical protein ACHAXS_010071 [Conticribra weissflogii]